MPTAPEAETALSALFQPTSVKMSPMFHASQFSLNPVPAAPAGTAVRASTIKTTTTKD